MYNDNRTSIFTSEVITAFADFLLACTSPQVNHLLCMTALSFLIVRIMLAALEQDLWCRFASAANKAIIAAMSADGSNITATLVSFILESFVYAYLNGGKTPSKQL